MAALGWLLFAGACFALPVALLTVAAWVEGSNEGP